MQKRCFDLHRLGLNLELSRQGLTNDYNDFICSKITIGSELASETVWNLNSFPIQVN